MRDVCEVELVQSVRVWGVTPVRVCGVIPLVPQVPPHTVPQLFPDVNLVLRCFVGVV